MDRPVCGTGRDNLENLEIMLDLPEQAATSSPTATFDQVQTDSEEASTWSFCAIIRGEIWDPSLLTTLLNEMESTLAPTLAISAIPSYASRNKSTEVLKHVGVEGYLKIKTCRQTVLGVIPEFRDKGLHAWLVHEQFSEAKKHHTHAILGWLEDTNAEIIDVCQIVGGEPDREWGLFEKTL